MQFSDVCSARVLQSRAAPFLPVFDQIETHLTGPTDAAFHEAEIETREAVDETTEENPARERMVRFGEVTDVVVSKVADRGAILPATAARMLGHGYAEIDTALPDWIVVIRAVQRDGIDIPSGLPRIAALRRGWNQPFLVAPQHDRSKAPLLDRVVQLIEGFVRRYRWNDCDWRKSGSIRRKHVRRHHIVGAHCVPVQLYLGHAVDAEPKARIDQREVDAQFRKPLV